MRKPLSLQRQRTARVCWQLGLWEQLLELELDGASEGSLASDSATMEALKLQVQAALQLGEISRALNGIAVLEESGVGLQELACLVLSSSFNSISRAWTLIGNDQAAERCALESVALYPELGDPEVTARIRYSQQIRNLEDEGALFRHVEQRPGKRCLFIDCGGYDGCSALQFLLENPHFDCVSFEPNPKLWEHYEDIPTRLIPKAAYTYDGEIPFTIDPVDFDGSSIISSKRVDVDGRIENRDCPVITVPCVDISKYILEASKHYDRLILKLDVEGAEYDILEKMLRDGSIDTIETLYCEFHVGKMDLPPDRHKNLVLEVSSRTRVRDWDALPFSFSRKETRSARLKRRNRLIRAIVRNRTQSVPLPHPSSRSSTDRTHQIIDRDP